MALYFIGIGLSDEKDITLKGLELVKAADVVYLENYTSLLNVPVSKLERLYGKKIVLAERELVEKKAEGTVLGDAKERDVAFLVVGDPFAATTHCDLLLRAKKLGIPIEVVHNASVLTAVGVTGLQLYKFGKTASIPFPGRGFEPEAAYDVIKQNKHLGLHTLVLFDLGPEEKKFMSVNQAVDILLKIESRRRENVFTKDAFCVGCSGLGSEGQVIKAGKASELMNVSFDGLQCLVVPGQMHFVEEESLQRFRE